MRRKWSFWFAFSFFVIASSLSTQAQLLWTVGLDDNGWPLGDGGGANTSFVQENGSVNDLPGSADSTEDPQGADNDYYFAGVYTTVIAGNGDYSPVGVVSVDEEAAERAFAAADLDLRYHFNLPATLRTNDELTVTFDANNLDALNDVNTDPRFGIEVYFNNVLVQTQILIRPAQLGIDYTTPKFTLAKVNAQTGPGFDNIVSLRGISYNAEGGGNWMGIDYVQLNVIDQSAPPAIKFPWTIGRDDDGWPVGDGGEANASFVQENGAVSPLPGSPVSTETPQGADNDYYLAGSYTNVIAGNGSYTPVGRVSVNEEAAERAFAGGDLDLRYHFNLPASMGTNEMLAITFDALNLDDPNTVNTDPRFGIEIYFNNVLVQTQILIRPAQLGIDYTTPPFSLAKVNAKTGPGFDNIVSLRGISYNAEGGGNWMGIDYVALNPVAPPTPFPWSVGRDDDGWPAGDGGEANASFVQENGATSALPGSPISTETPQGADNDYYLAGTYSTVIPGNGTYTPVGPVVRNEEAAERAFAGGDLDLRYHFNLPTSLRTNDQLTVTWDALNLDDLNDVNTDPRFGIEVYFNSVLVQTQIVIRPTELNIPYTTAPFTLASVNARTGPGFDNFVSLRGISYNAEGGGNWMGIDYVKLDAVADTNAPLSFLPPTISNGQITLNWTGNGELESAPTVLGPWSPVTPRPTPPYSEAVAPGQMRFYRLKRL